MKVVKNRLDETYYVEVLPNGLTIYLAPKADFHKTYALFATKYGSIDNEFIPRNQNKFVRLPYGIAHFLEHKMFETTDEEDINQQFARFGADTNAYTSYDQTVYLFSTTQNIDQAINLLLDFVQTPAYTKATIEEEKGIIEQELLMYMDRPSTAIINASLESLYLQNDARIDIGGTPKSIHQIKKADLDLAYQTFYHPSNMCLVVVGKVDVEHLLEVIKKNQSSKDYPPAAKIRRRYYLEDNQIVKAKHVIKMDIEVPKVSINLKLDLNELDATAKIKADLAISALMYHEFDQTADFYRELENKQLVNNSFEYEVIVEDTFAFISITCDTYDYYSLAEEIKNHLLLIPKIVISEAEFKQYLRVTKAEYIRHFNSIDFFAGMIVDAHFANIDVFAENAIIDSLTLADVEDAKCHFTSNAISVVEIVPKKHK